MQFSRIVTFFALFFTFALVAFAKPVEKRQESGLTDPLTSVLTEIESILGSTDASNAGASLSSITSLLTELETTLSGLDASSLKKRDIVTDVALLLDEIITDVVKVIDFVLIPVIDEAVIDVDVALNKIILVVDGLVPGVILIVDQLLGGVGALLEALGLQLVFATLGL